MIKIFVKKSTFCLWTKPKRYKVALQKKRLGGKMNIDIKTRNDWVKDYQEIYINGLIKYKTKPTAAVEAMIQLH